jgi:hypothetical protein
MHGSENLKLLWRIYGNEGMSLRTSMQSTYFHKWLIFYKGNKLQELHIYYHLHAKFEVLMVRSITNFSVVG